MLIHFVALSLASAAPQSQPATDSIRPPAEAVAPAYVPHPVYAARRNRFTDFEAMVADLTYADVVLLGEQHDDAATHRLETATLEGLARRRSNVVLTLEMFERDVQGPLSDYLAGKIAEPDFLAGTRPWPRYRTDYRPRAPRRRRAHSWCTSTAPFTATTGSAPRSARSAGCAASASRW